MPDREEIEAVAGGMIATVFQCLIKRVEKLGMNTTRLTTASRLSMEDMEPLWR